MYNVPVKFSSTNNYGCEEDCEDDVYTVAEFIEHACNRTLINDDGFGFPVKDNLADEDIMIMPSSICLIPNDATHIVWYNR
jgi:hypothetical protein